MSIIIAAVYVALLGILTQSAGHSFLPVIFYGCFFAASISVVGFIARGIQGKGFDLFNIASFNVPPYAPSNIKSLYFAILYFVIGALFYLLNYISSIGSGMSIRFVDTFLFIPTYIISIALFFWPLLAYQSTNTPSLVAPNFPTVFGSDFGTLLGVLRDNLANTTKIFNISNWNLTGLQYIIPLLSLIGTLALAAGSVYYMLIMKQQLYVIVTLLYVGYARLILQILLDQNLVNTLPSENTAP